MKRIMALLFVQLLFVSGSRADEQPSSSPTAAPVSEFGR